MAVSLTGKQRDLLDYIRSYIAANRQGPTYEEMMDHLGIRSKSGAFRIVKCLEERGHIRTLPNRARAIELVGEGTAVAPLPAVVKPKVIVLVDAKGFYKGISKAGDVQVFKRVV